MEVRGHRGAVAFDGTTVTLTERGGNVVQFPAGCVCAAWVDPAGRGLRSLSFTVVTGATVVTYRMIFSWRCAEQLQTLREQVMTVRLYGAALDVAGSQVRGFGRSRRSPMVEPRL